MDMGLIRTKIQIFLIIKFVENLLIKYGPMHIQI